jgi:hypothetical protein
MLVRRMMCHDSAKANNNLKISLIMVLLKIISATRKAPKYQSKPPSTSDTQDKAHRKASEVYTARRIEQARIVPASPGTGGWNARMTSTNRSNSLQNKALAIYPPASGYESMLAFSKVSICRFGLLPCGV